MIIVFKAQGLFFWGTDGLIAPLAEIAVLVALWDHWRMSRAL